VLTLPLQDEHAHDLGARRPVQRDGVDGVSRIGDLLANDTG
jgi:hypothetical protein